jgi:hypothetical protein
VSWLTNYKLQKNYAPLFKETSKLIPMSVLKDAKLIVELSFSVVPWNKTTTEMF